MSGRAVDNCPHIVRSSNGLGDPIETATLTMAVSTTDPEHETALQLLQAAGVLHRHIECGSIQPGYLAGTPSSLSFVAMSWPCDPALTDLSMYRIRPSLPM